MDEPATFSPFSFSISESHLLLKLTPTKSSVKMYLIVILSTFLSFFPPYIIHKLWSVLTFPFLSTGKPGKPSDELPMNLPNLWFM